MVGICHLGYCSIEVLDVSDGRAAYRLSSNDGAEERVHYVKLKRNKKRGDYFSTPFGLVYIDELRKEK